MSKHNYSQYSNKNNRPNVKTTELPVSYQGNVMVVDETAVPETKATTTVAAPVAPLEIKMEPSVTPTPAHKTVKGTVANCAKLNVRAEPSTTGEVVCVLDANSEIEIDVSKSNKDWFSICTVSGINGYCMRKFVNARL